MPDSYASLARKELVKRASGGKLSAFGVNGNSKTAAIIAALRKRDAAAAPRSPPARAPLAAAAQSRS